MDDYIATALFVVFITTLYVVLISRYSVTERRIRAWRSKREELRTAGKKVSQSKHDPDDPRTLNGADCGRSAERRKRLDENERERPA